MPEPGKGDQVVAEFTTLELEGEGEQPDPKRLEALLSYLGENLETDQVAKVREILGIKKDLSHAELLAEIKKALQDYPPPNDKKKKKKPGEEEEVEAADYKGFMTQCMKSGKKLTECAAEWKKKYPGPEKEPKKEEVAEVEQLAMELAKKKRPEDEEEEEKLRKKKEEEEYPEPVKKKMEDLSAQVKDLTAQVQNLVKQRELGSVETEVSGLVQARHLSPRQKDAILQLSAKLPPAERQELYDFFRKTQKFTVTEDVGQQGSEKQGEVKGFTEEERMVIAERHGIRKLIEEKGDKTVKGRWWSPKGANN